jgi:hypothetical protein
MAKWCDEGENRVADILFDDQAVDATLYLGLYENSTEPAEDATLAGITEQAGGTGYARIELTRGTWTVTGSVASYAQQTFTANGGDWGDQYGYFIATSSDGSGKLLCVEHFSDGPYAVTDGDSVKITPSITVG